MAEASKEFVTSTLPQLVDHYHNKELHEVQKIEWLNDFQRVSSSHLYKKARQAFDEDGLLCISSLEEYSRLLTLAEGNECLTREFQMLYLQFVIEAAREMEGRALRRLGESELEGTPAAADLRDLGQTFKDLGNRALYDDEKPFYEAAQRKCDLRSLPEADTAIYRSIFERAWQLVKANKNSIDTLHLKRFHIAQEALQMMERKYADGIAGSVTLTTFNQALRSFVYSVGCPRAHNDAESNIAELRLIRATQMPFFSKLQEDFQEQLKINARQQEVITALTFRHLIETLPPNPYGGKTDSTGRWQAYWKDMVITMDRKRAAGQRGHPLEGLIGQGVVVNGDVTAESQKYRKGLEYRMGSDLFGILSDNIHQYQDAGDVAGQYAIRDDQWGLTVRKILERLIPIHINAQTGEVTWAAERQRFV